MAGDPLDPGNLFGHVQDADYFHVPRSMTAKGDGHVAVPQPLVKFDGDKPIEVFSLQTGVPKLDELIEPFELKITKFMVLEVVIAVIIAVVFIRLAGKMKAGGAPKGRIWNMLEAMLLYFRDHVARPAIGKHDADRFLPLLWTLFFFVLGCNLMGMIPWMGSPTGALAVTGMLAIITFGTVVCSGMKALGVVGFWKAQVPHMDLPFILAIFLVPMIFVIELLGLFIKHFVLAIRLLANMMAGHVVLSVIMAFIVVTAEMTLWWGVMPASVLGATALSMLELFVAFLQAYIFTFLSALFIGAAVHAH
jgi:F-type H+-transporting ATPase subunit a